MGKCIGGTTPSYTLLIHSGRGIRDSFERDHEFLKLLRRVRFIVTLCSISSGYFSKIAPLMILMYQISGGLRGSLATCLYLYFRRRSATGKPLYPVKTMKYINWIGPITSTPHSCIILILKFRCLELRYPSYIIDNKIPLEKDVKLISMLFRRY